MSRKAKLSSRLLKQTIARGYISIIPISHHEISRGRRISSNFFHLTHLRRLWVSIKKIQIFQVQIQKREKNQFMSRGDSQIKFTCRPLGRQWGRATGPLETERCSTPSFKFRPCTPVRIHGIRSERLPYGFGIYARELFPSGLPCSQRFCQPADTCKKYFYPCLPTKPAKIYSSYTFSQRGAPYTCPNCPPATCCSAQLVWALCYCGIKFNEALEVTNVLCFSHDGEDSPRSESRKHQIKPR